MYVCSPHVFSGLLRPKKVIGSFGTIITRTRELMCRQWELIPGHLYERTHTDTHTGHLSFYNEET